MQRFRSLTTVVALLVCVSSAHAQVHEDVTRVMPDDTAMYLGWSAWTAPDDPRLVAGRQQLVSLISLEDEVNDPDLRRLLAAGVGALVDLQTLSGGIGLFDVDVSGSEPRVHAGAVLAAGERAAELQDLIGDALRHALGPDAVSSVRVSGHEFHQIRSTADFPVLWGIHQDYLVVATSASATGRILACIDGTAPTLADAAELQFNRGKVGARTDGSLFCFYADVQRVVDRALEIAAELRGAPLPAEVEPWLGQLGVRSVRSKYFHLERRESGMYGAAFAHIDGPMTGLLKVWDQKPLTESDLNILPRDAYWAEIGNLDLYGIWSEARRIMEELAPQALPQVDGGLAMAAQMLGFSPTEDLLATLGDTWAAFDAPAHGGILLTGTVLTVDVKDAERLDGMLRRTVALIGGFALQAGAEVVVKETRHGEHDIRYVLVGGQPVPVAPAWGFVDGRCVLGLFPQTVAAALQQVDPKTRTGSVLENESVRRVWDSLPGKKMGFAYYNIRYLTRLLYPLGNAFQTAAVSLLGGDAEIDLTLMPPMTEAVAAVDNGIITWTRDDDGVTYQVRGDIGELALAATSTAAVATSIALPALATARAQAKMALTMANLRGVGQACMIYAFENDDRLPPNLDALLETETVTEKMLTSPLLPGDERAVVYVGAGRRMSRIQAPAQTVLAYLRPDGLNEIAVLFADGHVERMDITEASPQIRQAHEEAGLMDSLPERFRR